MTKRRHIRQQRPTLPPPPDSQTRAGLVSERFLSDRQLAERWNCSPRTLRNLRCLQKGVDFVRLGRLVRYRLSDVLSFEAAHASAREETV
jgi:hypothetical protein